MSDWFDGYVESLQKSVDEKIPIKVNDVLVIIRQEIVNLIKENRVSLIRIGKNLFKEFLSLMSQGEQFEALTKVYGALDNSELVQKYKEDTVKLAEIAAQVQADRDFWVSFGVKVGEKVIFSALGALL